MVCCTAKKNADNNVFTQGRDTVLINNKVFYLDSIPKSLFKTAEKTKFIEGENEIIDDTSNVSRDSLLLTFHLKNGSDLVLKNDTSQDYSNYIAYNYLSSLATIDYWLLRISYYEGRAYMLVDKENGKKIDIWGEPVFSPSNKYFICYSFDMEAAYDPNGMQLFEIRGRKVNEKWSYLISDWGPSEIRWKNDTIIYLEQAIMDYENSPDGYIETYKSMIIQ
jgi:hypothetical protein